MSYSGNSYDQSTADTARTGCECETGEGQSATMLRGSLDASQAGLFSRFKQVFATLPFGKSSRQVVSQGDTITKKQHCRSLSSRTPALTSDRYPHLKPSLLSHSSQSPQQPYVVRERAFTSASDTSSSPVSSCFSPASLSSHPTIATSAHEDDCESWPPSDGKAAARGIELKSARDKRSAKSEAAPADTRLDGETQVPQFVDSLVVRNRYDSIEVQAHGSRLEDISIANADVTCKLEEYGEWWGLGYTMPFSQQESRTTDTSSSVEKSKVSDVRVRKLDLPHEHRVVNLGPLFIKALSNLIVGT